MNIVLNKITTLSIILLGLTTPVAFAEDVSVEPGVVELGEPKNMPDSQAAQEIHAKIKQIEEDIRALKANTAKEVEAMQREVKALKEEAKRKFHNRHEKY